jgi:hypothetical protein
MNLKIKLGLRDQSEKVRKHAGFLPYLYALGGMVCFALLYLGFIFINISSLAWVNFVGIALVIAFIFVGLPLLYGVSCLIGNATRFNEEKNLSLKTCFDKYYHGNPGFFSTSGIIFKGVLIEIFTLLVTMSVAEYIVNIYYPGFAEMITSIYEQGEAVYLSDYSLAMGDYSRLFEVFCIIVMSVGQIPLFIFASSELRKNESVYYAANVLVSDNYIDVATRPLVPLFRREILPLVKKEHNSYNLSLNYMGYIVFYILYLGVVIFGVFLPQVPFAYVSFIAFAIAIVAYTPFYYRQRVFDALFYIAYSDKMMNRASDKIKQIIKAGRSQIMPKVDKFKNESGEYGSDDTNGFDQDDEFKDNSSYGSSPKKGDYDSTNDEVDFTKNKDEEDEKDDENKDK